VFPNLDEGRLLTGRDEPEAIVTVLLETYPLVALKLGAAGALVAAADGRRVPMAAQPAEVVDSTGAGDAFCAGFLTPWVAWRRSAGMCPLRGQGCGKSHRSGWGAPENELTLEPTAGALWRRAVHARWYPRGIPSQ